MFTLCEKARTDDRFALYPPLPVLSCIGYERVAGEEKTKRGREAGDLEAGDAETGDPGAGDAETGDPEADDAEVGGDDAEVDES